MDLSETEFLTAMFGTPTEQVANIRKFQGVEFSTFSYRNYYLHYEIDDKQNLLAFIASMPAEPSSELRSDQECQKGKYELQPYESTFFPKEEFLDLSSVAFWHPEQITNENREYYVCLRFPWSHSLMFDLSINQVYHVVEEIVRE